MDRAGFRPSSIRRQSIEVLTNTCGRWSFSNTSEYTYPSAMRFNGFLSLASLSLLYSTVLLIFAARENSQVQGGEQLSVQTWMWLTASGLIWVGVSLFIHLIMRSCRELKKEHKKPGYWSPSTLAGLVHIYQLLTQAWLTYMIADHSNHYTHDQRDLFDDNRYNGAIALPILQRLSFNNFVVLTMIFSLGSVMLLFALFAHAAMRGRPGEEDEDSDVGCCHGSYGIFDEEEDGPKTSGAAFSGRASIHIDKRGGVPARSAYRPLFNAHRSVYRRA